MGGGGEEGRMEGSRKGEREGEGGGIEGSRKGKREGVRGSEWSI